MLAFENTHTLDVQYRDGRPDETLTYPAAEAVRVWNYLTDSPAMGAVQYAVWKIPSSGPKGYRVRGTFGVEREDGAALMGNGLAATVTDPACRAAGYCPPMNTCGCGGNTPRN